ncbi:hypothetical protein Z517_12340 [Fonsecaea pedrosoi CBS 271.37]|uniref:Uncharacterized protein n=1 Tax=Fonsecaea pedrosoi CBS 271.37 TaxID=1442368 RepID=A0A0D2G6Q0_9EURO|nr:uncharacterized protein Z517_12340 [Fonsecaea pedrosoi CBS 271.37]KIW74400.1 hypothetical protein Z517_12340 [Fonsecaea pedrosoi CBS 271.37]
MDLGQFDNSDQFNFDPPATTPSSTRLESTFYIHSNGMDTANGSAGNAANGHPYLTDMADPFVAGDPSQLYQSAMDVAPDNVNDVTNGTLEDVFGSLVPDADPATVFGQSDDDEFAMLLQAYVERGPSPTQGGDEDWSNMAATSNPINEPSGKAGASTASPHAVAADATDILSTPKNNVSAAPATSPATPGSASQKLIEAMSNSPIEIPRTAEFADFHPRSPSLKKESENVKRRSGGNALTNTEAISRSSPPQQNTPATQKLGSPFKMPGFPASASAKQIPADIVSMGSLYSPSPAPGQPLPMGTVSTCMPALPGYSSLTNTQMQLMAYQRSRTGSTNYTAAPNTPNVKNELLSSGGGSSSFLDYGSSSAEQPSAKRARMDIFGSHQAFQHTPRTTKSMGLTLAEHFNDDIVGDFKWLERDRTDPSPPPSTVARYTGFEFPVPLPSGTMVAIENEAEEDVVVGKKRKARHMSQDGIETNNTQGPSTVGSFVNAQAESAYLGMFQLPDQDQPMLGMQTQHQMPDQAQLQAHLHTQACGQFQHHSKPQLHMHGQTQFHGQLQQSLSHSRASSSQQQPPQQAQGRRASLHRRADRQQQLLGYSPNAARERVPDTPTPASRRRSTHSRAGPKASLSSPRSGTPRKNTQTSNSRASQTPKNKSARKKSCSQSSTKTPAHDTPAALRSHLPTPQQPISTGSCPNTISETLAETNRRTEEELRSLGAPVVDYDPNMNWDNMADAPAGTLFGDIGLLDAGHMTFSEMMGIDMFLPAAMDTCMPHDGSENAAGLESTLLNTAVSTSGYPEGFMMPDSGNHDTATDANMITIGDGSFEMGIAVSATGTAGPGVSCDWTNGFEENKDFDPMDFGF